MLVFHVAVLLIRWGVALGRLVVGDVLHRALVVQDETLSTADTFHLQTGEKQYTLHW